MADFKIREPSEGLRRRKSLIKESISLNERVESILTETNYNTIQFIEVEKLKPFKGQKRTYFDTERLKELADTIKQHGIRQPLTVIQSDDSIAFEIVSGERRFLAAKMVGLDKVPCIIIHDRKAAEEIAIIENVQRVDLHPIELGRAYEDLLKNDIVASHKELSEKIGIPRTQVSEYISFSRIPTDISEQLISNGILLRRILRKIAKCDNHDEMEKILRHAINSNNKSNRKIIATFSLTGSSVDMKLYDKLKLTDEEIKKLEQKVEELFKYVKQNKTE